MRKGIGAVIGLTALSVFTYVAWDGEWFVSTPASIFKETINKANAGDYTGASQNLPPKQCKNLLENPEGMKQIWDIITKNRTVRYVTIIEENREYWGEAGYVRFTIHYDDGSEISAQEIVGTFDGEWKHTVSTLHEKLVKEP